MQKRKGMVCGTVLGLLSVIANAEPVIEAKTETYPVVAKHLDELSAALDAASPIRKDGKVFHGFTNTHVNWRYFWQSSRSGCRLHRVTTTVRIHYQMPALKPGADAELKAVWQRYYAALELHERGHGNIAVDAAREIERRLLALPAETTCETLDQVAGDTATAILEQHRPRHEQYDLATDHGRTQGAHLELHLPKR